MKPPFQQLAVFDFLRGWSAILVFFHHAALLGGGPNWLKGDIGHEAVNLFMLCSGFLIYYQSKISRSYGELKNKTGVYNFYIRRFFRIAPAFYFALIFAYILAPSLGEMRQALADAGIGSLSSTDRYEIDDLGWNVFTHLTFLFGLIPSQAFSTPLPDWSLGLEMQFYLVFPLLFWGLRKKFLLAFLGALVFFFCLKVGVARGLNIHFPMPSFLPLKFANFAAGMLLAQLYLTANLRHKVPAILLAILFLILGNKSPWTALCLLALVAFLGQSKSTWKKPLERIFQHKSSKWLAEASYGLYIFHLLLMIPFYHFTLATPPSFAQWLGLSIGLLLICLVVAWLVFLYIEKPGISLGKKLLKPLPQSKER